jgi:hypothetical protein
MTHQGFDDTNFDIAQNHLIYQLNNLSHFLHQPADAIWKVVLDGTEAEIEAFFNKEDGVRDIAQATVRALCAIYLLGATVTPFHIDSMAIWSEVRDDDALSDWYERYDTDHAEHDE